MGGSYCFWHRMRMHWISKHGSSNKAPWKNKVGQGGGSDKLSISFCALVYCGLPCHCLCFFFSFWCITFPLVRIRSSYFWDRECLYSFNLLLLATCLPHLSDSLKEWPRMTNTWSLFCFNLPPEPQEDITGWVWRILILDFALESSTMLPNPASANQSGRT